MVLHDTICLLNVCIRVTVEIVRLIAIASSCGEGEVGIAKTVDNCNRELHCVPASATVSWSSEFNHTLVSVSIN